jgi:hypothetical protein
MTGLSSPATVTATLCLQCVFKMAMSIQSPAKCEVRAVIRFLHAKGETAAEIHLSYPLYRRLSGPQSRSGRHGEAKILDPTGTRTPTSRSSSQ